MTKEESIKKQTEETTSFWLKVIAISGSFLFLLLTAVSYFTWDGNFINGMIINISAALALYGIYLLAGIYIETRPNFLHSQPLQPFCPPQRLN